MDLRAHWNGCAVYLTRGDITKLEVDAVVNAANAWLAGGGGVDGAIHRAGGPAIAAKCRQLVAARTGTLATGEAVLTAGGKLPARHVIHTVGPVHGKEAGREAELLAAAYRNCLALARSHGLSSLAFPCVSTGAYGYPSEEAGAVAVSATRAELDRFGQLERLIFCTFEQGDHEVYDRRLRERDR
jgi:O-acetyl-ADP-ribose deacetylase (regulator of RNase III)